MAFVFFMAHARLKPVASSLGVWALTSTSFKGCGVHRLGAVELGDVNMVRGPVDMKRGLVVNLIVVGIANFRRVGLGTLIENQSIFRLWGATLHANPNRVLLFIVVNVNGDPSADPVLFETLVGTAALLAVCELMTKGTRSVLLVDSFTVEIRVA